MVCHRHDSSFLVLPKSLFPLPGKMDSEHQASSKDSQQLRTRNYDPWLNSYRHCGSELIELVLTKCGVPLRCAWSCNPGDGLRVRL
jgi:hypothetical protein